jgi:hypothetical protein
MDLLEVDSDDIATGKHPEILQNLLCTAAAMHTNLSFKEDISASEINSTQNAH